MKICVISDTHEKHEQIKIPKCDILIHCGDCTNKGSLISLYKFCTWFEQQPAKYKVLVYGNHELGFSHGSKREEAIKTPKQFGITYLENSNTIIDGLYMYGSPVTPFYYGWEWNVHRGKEIAYFWNKIPNDIDILITHGPPYGILDLTAKSSNRDLHQGCEELIKKINTLDNLKLHAFGHLHQQQSQIIELNNTKFVNAAIVDDCHNVIHQPVIIDL